eukprot:TRINITY_DN5542_c0_g2_i1.p1 TRINITY_DN5542_c0_g2~~TRINITY_DN5542_c0_g2_i1.p1  ORF type:complete len:623 (+),score=96.76 TRINITY_DN5542_c0_g2_i1:76-1944(+)
MLCPLGRIPFQIFCLSLLLISLPRIVDGQAADRIAVETDAVEHAGEEAEHGEHGEEGEEKEEEEEEEHFGESDIEVAGMLLGAVTVVVFLFMLANYPDDEIRYYTMNIISMTVSIFAAVLFYQGINQVLESWMESQEYQQEVKCVIQFCHCAIYIIIMQLTILWISGLLLETGETEGTKVLYADLSKEEWVVADGLRGDFGRLLVTQEKATKEEPSEEQDIRALQNGDTAAKKSVWVDGFGIEVPVEKKPYELDIRKRRMRCYGMLLAHMSGFAAITAGGKIQHMELFKHNAMMCFLPVPLTMVLLQMLYFMSGWFRDRQSEAAREHDPSGKRSHLCHEYVVEAENDVSSLALSFLTTQVLRFAISGVLPNFEGLEEPAPEFSAANIGSLYGFGAVAAVVAVIIALANKEEHEVDGDKGGHGAHGAHHAAPVSNISHRINEIASNTFAMVFAWCTLFGTRWLLFSLPASWNWQDPATMIGRILLAVVLSIYAGVFVFALDAIDDYFREKAGAEASGRAIRTIIQALAILVGFSWEHSFDGGVAAIASMTEHHAVTKLTMGSLVFLVIVPIWRRNILTKVMAYETLKELRRKSKQTKGMEAKHPEAEGLTQSSQPVSSREGKA